MPYRGGELVDLAPKLDRGVRLFGRRATKAVGDELKDRVQVHTPVAKQTKEIRASYGSLEEWVHARRREPGELRDSWRVGPVEVILEGGESFSIDVYTRDPVAPFVEYPTRPHVIRARKLGGVLTIPTAHGMRYATMVHHPGTQGSYMLMTALAEIAAEWRGIVEREWETEIRRIWTRRG